MKQRFYFSSNSLLTIYHWCKQGMHEVVSWKKTLRHRLWNKATYWLGHSACFLLHPSNNSSWVTLSIIIWGGSPIHSYISYQSRKCLPCCPPLIFYRNSLNSIFFFPGDLSIYKLPKTKQHKMIDVWWYLMKTMTAKYFKNKKYKIKWLQRILNLSYFKNESTLHLLIKGKVKKK